MLKSIPLAAAFGAFVLATTPARSADTDFGATAADPITAKECGDCHMAFAPIKLPGRSWVKIMGDLANHFGEDASLDPATAKHIEEYLVSKSMDGGGTMFGKISYKKLMKKQPKDYTPIRITETRDWLGDHRSEKYKRMLSEKKMNSGANCVLCHKGAPEGKYEEFDKLPK
ncbi:cytochrome C [Magnetovibrio sp.]|uniref:cytochrome C n=1 Tax=Magnetovibrio sp. TaxID=2024836 RepID=UPI002F954B01